MQHYHERLTLISSFLIVSLIIPIPFQRLPLFFLTPLPLLSADPPISRHIKLASLPSPSSPPLPATNSGLLETGLNCWLLTWAPQRPPSHKHHHVGHCSSCSFIAFANGFGSRNHLPAPLTSDQGSTSPECVRDELSGGVTDAFAPPKASRWDFSRFNGGRRKALVPQS